MPAGADDVDLVIFDCDGVLVDSEPLANRVFADLLTEEGLPTTFEQSVARYMGLPMDAAVALVEADLGRPVRPGFVDRYHQRIFAAFDAGLRAVPGVAGALDALAVATCVASSGEHRKIRRSLAITGLLDRFEGRIFSATDVARGKPFPDLFLHAAASLGADPARCTVVEDSPAGVAAARAAGMRVLGYAAMTPAARLADADRTFTDMACLPELI
jgi:HAD superfamily hydrolase (TIGR01509 family)